MKIRPIITITAIVVIIIVVSFTFISTHSFVKIKDYQNETGLLLSMNNAFQIENGFLNNNDYTSENYSGGVLYDNPKGFLGYAAIPKSVKVCEGFLGNLSECPIALYRINTRINNSKAKEIIMRTSLYSDSNKAHEMFELQLKSLNSSNSSTATLTLNNPNILKGGLGEYSDEYALFTHPQNINNTQYYLHIILFRRENVLLEAETLNEKQIFSPSFWQVSQSISQIEAFNKNYFASS